MLKFDWNFLIMLINLVIFFLLMKRFLFKPILSVMDKRKEMINKQFEEAESTQQQALELKKQYEEKIEDISNESRLIIDDAKQSARVEYGKILSKAEEDAEKFRQDAIRRTNEECENERRAAREDIAKLAMEAAAKVIGTSVSAQTNSDIFDEFLNEGSDGNDAQNG